MCIAADSEKMGACCGGMKTSDQKSLPENQKTTNSVDDMKDKCPVNGPHGDATVTTDHQQQQPAAAALDQEETSGNHTANHSAVSPDQVELKITEPLPAAACPVTTTDKLEDQRSSVCSVAEPSHQSPQPTDDGAVGDKPSTEAALTVSEDVEVAPPTSVSELTRTTTRVEEQHVEEMTSCSEVTSTVDQSTDAAAACTTSVVKDQQPDVEPETLTTGAADMSAVEQTTEHGPSATTTDDQAGADLVETTQEAEAVVETSADDRQESALAPEQVEQVPAGQETIITGCVDVASEQQLSTVTDCEVVETSACVEPAAVTTVEPRHEDAAAAAEPTAIDESWTQVLTRSVDDDTETSPTSVEYVPTDVTIDQPRQQRESPSAALVSLLCCSVVIH